MKLNSEEKIPKKNKMNPPLEIIGYLNLLTAFLALTAGNLVISRPRTSFNLIIYHLFYAISVWSIFHFLGINASTPSQALWFYALSSLGWSPFPIFLFYLVYLLVYNRWQRTPVKFKILLTIPPLLLSTWILSEPDYFYQVKYISQGYLKELAPGWKFIYLYWLITGMIGLGLVLFKFLPGRDSYNQEQKKIINLALYMVLFLFGFRFGISKLFDSNFLLGPIIAFPLIMIVFKYMERLNLFRTYKEIMFEYEKIKLLYENTRALIEINDLNELLNTIAQNAKKATGSRAVAITLFENNLSITKVLAGLNSPLIKKGFELAGINPINFKLKIKPERISCRLIQEKKSFLVKSFWEQIDQIIPKWQADLAQKIAGIKVMVNTPIIMDGECIGTIIYASTEKVDEEKLKFYEMFTNQASQAIKKAKLIEQIQRANQELERKVQERTRELELAKIQLEKYSQNLEKEVEKQTRALRKASEKMVELAHLAGKAEVSAGILHNIGNALNTIYVRMDRLQELCARLAPEDMKEIFLKHLLSSEGIKKLSSCISYQERVKEYINLKMEELTNIKQEAEKNFQHLRNRIEHIGEILSLQKNYSSGKTFKEPLQINQIIEDALNMLEDSIQKRQVQIELKLDESLPLIYQSRGQLLQVVVNLLKNALEAMDGSPPENRQLKIQSQKENGQIKIVITDSGVGIEKENLDNIFQYGYSTKKNSQGIGLAISKYLVKQMGGEIYVQSPGKGRGASFFIILPVEIPQQEFSQKSVA